MFCKSLQLIKVYGTERPVFVQLFCYDKLTNSLSTVNAWCCVKGEDGYMNCMHVHLSGADEA